MKQKNEQKPPSGGVGRKTAEDPAIFRYTIRMNAEQNAKFMQLLEQSGLNNISRFILARIFNETFKVIKVDKNTIDYYTKLTQLVSQFRMIGVNYNQIVKLLNTHFTEKKALASLYKLEKETIQLVQLNQQIIILTRQLEEKWLHE
ncbi:MAG: hypothetical protein LUE98_09435 [Tannerellaceae bacterium]|nr:hypothetical protein [Tannerellaceae bacterium]